MVSLAFITRKFSLCSCILSNRNCIRLPPLLSTGNPIWWGWNTECNIAMPGEKIHSMSEHKIEPGFIGPNPKALLPMIGSLLPGNVLSTPYDRKSLSWQCTIYSLWSEVSYLAMYCLLPSLSAFAHSLWAVSDLLSSVRTLLHSLPVFSCPRHQLFSISLVFSLPLAFHWTGLPPQCLEWRSLGWYWLWLAMRIQMLKYSVKSVAKDEHKLSRVIGINYNQWKFSNEKGKKPSVHHALISRTPRIIGRRIK